MNKITMRTFSVSAIAVASSFVFGCSGGNGRTVEVVVVEEPPDIPGVDTRAVQAFVNGINAMEEQPTNYEDALAQFEAAVQYDENFWEAWENIGLIQMDLARYDEAIAAFDQEMLVVSDLVSRGWPVDPRPEILLNIGSANAQAGRFTDAVNAFTELLSIDENNVEARANMAALNVQQGNFAQAREYIGELLEMSQNDIGALNVLARIYRIEGDVSMAVYLWEKAMGLVASVTDSLTDESQYEDLSEEDASRLRAYNQGRVDRMTRTISDVQNELGILRWEEGDHDASEALFREAVGSNPYNYSALTNLGTVFLEYAFFDDACAQFSEALALRPRNEQALVGIAACTYGVGDPDGAYAAYDTVFSNYPNNEFAAEQLGNISFRDRGDQDAAERWYLENLSLRGIDAVACDPQADRVCAAVQSIRMFREQQN